MPTWMLLLAGLALGGPRTQALSPSTVPLETFRGFDQDGDGRAEIERIERIAERAGKGERVLLLVEPRLLEDLPGAPPLLPRIERLADDLAAEGRAVTALAVHLAPSDRHQDGLYVLALRELLREYAAAGPLAGALLVGHFPDAVLVRTCNWRKRGKVTLHRKTPEEQTYTDTRFLRRVPEDVAHRADIVLADLDGHWEERYVGPPTALPSVVAVFPDGIPAGGGECVDVQVSARTFEDVFHISDGHLSLEQRDGADGARVTVVGLNDRVADAECSAAEAATPNGLPVPDVLVSRIDARGTAWAPNPGLVDDEGRGLLDAEGRPQTLTFADAEHAPHWNRDVWVRDPVLERELLADYLDRNHRYRTGAEPVTWRPASIACDLPSGYASMAQAADDWEEGAAIDVRGKPTLAQFVDWMREPAVLRTVRAHSDPYGSVFRKADVGPLEERLGEAPLAWSRRGNRLEPSLRAACGGGKLDWFLLRALREHDGPDAPAAFYVHTGCHGISPPGALKRDYMHPSYGRMQGAEALLFFGGGLALVGRAKVFYDEPRGFAACLAQGRTFGEAWRHYFVVESGRTWGRAGGDIGRKRATFWSVLGDWTLRLGRDGQATPTPTTGG